MKVYRILTGPDDARFCHRVTEALSRGWELYGDPALTYDPEKAGGLDAALDTVRQQPFGTVLLVVMALGIACFGAFCFVWARKARY